MPEHSATPDAGSPAAEKAAYGKASETLSQFIARVLTQLSLSAWLPSAALVLSLTFVIQLGSVLDSSEQSVSAWTAVGSALSRMAAIKIGGALLLFIAVVVLTIFTQAFSYEGIRVLEGYWGTFGPMRLYAAWRCNRFESRATKLRSKGLELTSKAWDEAEKAIRQQKNQAIKHQRTGVEALAWTPDMLTWLGAKLKEELTEVSLSRADQLTALGIPWRRFSKPDYLRRSVNIDKKLRDYPRPSQVPSNAVRQRHAGPRRCNEKIASRDLRPRSVRFDALDAESPAR